MKTAWTTIEHPEAYKEATKARIIANANKTFVKNGFACWGNPFKKNK